MKHCPHCQKSILSEQEEKVKKILMSSLRVSHLEEVVNDICVEIVKALSPGAGLFFGAEKETDVGSIMMKYINNHNDYYRDKKA